MLELTPDNALPYLQAQGWVGPGPVHITPLGWGVSNAVLRVETAEQVFVLKQSRLQLRTRDPWYSDLERVYREQEVMEVLLPLLPAGTVPQVLFSDRANYVFAMSAAPAEARVWKEMLLAGEVDLTLGERVGSLLGRIHEATARLPAQMKRFQDRTVFAQLRVEPFYERVQQRCPDIAGAVQQTVERMQATREALCHGDFSPKNILVHPDGFTLVDYETAHLGDLAMDLGFFLSHILLKAVKWHVQRQHYFDLTDAFWTGYGAVLRFRPLAELQARGIAHCAVCVLARIDGTSPVNYLPAEAERATARRLGRRLLREAPTRWQEVLDLANVELAVLP
jgi:5-methylthioribose kinase